MMWSLGTWQADTHSIRGSIIRLIANEVEGRSADILVKDRFSMKEALTIFKNHKDRYVREYLKTRAITQAYYKKL